MTFELFIFLAIALLLLFGLYVSFIYEPAPTFRINDLASELTIYVYYDPINDEIALSYIKMINPLELVYLGEL